MYGRVLRFNSITWGGLVGAVGLILTPSVFAAEFSSKPAAYAHCLNVLEGFLTNTSALTADAACVLDEAVKVVNGVTKSGGYICKFKTQTSQAMITNNRYNVGFCGISGSGTATNQNVEGGFYDSFTFTSRYPSADPFNSAYYYFWAGELDPCSDSVDIENSFRAPTANGSGNVCSGGCAYSVSVGYSGTWPTGSLYYTANALKRECQPGDETPTNDPLSEDTPPLDLDGETPEPGPEPGDGSGNSSSGGGSCDEPPKCQGDAIQCNILYQTWAGRCSGSGNGDGDGGGDGDGNGTDLTGVENKLDNLINQNDTIFGDDGSSFDPGQSGWDSLKTTKVLSSDNLDTSGLGFPRSCNFFNDTTIGVGVASITFDVNSTGVCNVFEWSGYLLVALASFGGCMILLRD